MFLELRHIQGDLFSVATDPQLEELRYLALSLGAIGHPRKPHSVLSNFLELKVHLYRYSRGEEIGCRATVQEYTHGFTAQRTGVLRWIHHIGRPHGRHLTRPYGRCSRAWASRGTGKGIDTPYRHSLVPRGC